MTIHKLEVSEPLVTDGYFAIVYTIDTEHKATGDRHGGKELGVYIVRDGKIVREQFFYHMSSTA